MSENVEIFLFKFCIIVFCFSGIFLVIRSQVDHWRVDEIEAASYCKMVNVYESDNNPNYNHKNGWPNYKHINCGDS